MFKLEGGRGMSKCGNFTDKKTTKLPIKIKVTQVGDVDIMSEAVEKYI